MRRYGLRDDQWDRIKDSLPGREGHVGDTAEDICLRRVRYSEMDEGASRERAFLFCNMLLIGRQLGRKK